MIALLTGKEMQVLDRFAIEDVGIPSMVLMETAGRFVTDAIEEQLVERGSSRALIVSGLGNNGGDAVVAARHLLNRGYAPKLVVIGDPARASGDLGRQLSIAEKLSIDRVVLTGDAFAGQLDALLSAHAVVADGLFGTGLSRAIEGPAALAIERINASGRPVVAIDLPSGIHADTGQVLGVAIKAAVTVTFGLPKLGHVLHPGRDHAGETRVVDIGIPYSLLDRARAAAELIDEDLVRRALPPREPDSHKGTYGHLLVVAGIPDRPGAALLTSRAAARAGAGLVTLASDSETIRRLAPSLVEVMGLSAGATRVESGPVLEALSTRTALAIGPSLVVDDPLAAAIQKVLLDSEVPAVVDAGALDAIGRDPSWLKTRRGPTVLTPHPGEASRLLGKPSREIQQDRPAAARALAAATGATVVLKGASTVVADPDGRLGVTIAGNAAMATGGTGDVLTGVIGALLAQRVPAPLAARAGVYLHGAAGDRVIEGGRDRLIASDLIGALFGPTPAGASIRPAMRSPGERWRLPPARPVPAERHE